MQHEELRFKQMPSMLSSQNVQDLAQPMVDSKEVLLGSGQAAVPQQSDRSNSTSNYFDFFVTFK